MLRLDHLAVSAETLDDGVSAIETALGARLAPGGAHAHMATHNRLLGLGDIYLEVIAVDPAAPAPAWPRWFDLDHFTGPPRLTNWIAACDDLAAELAQSPAGAGRAVDLARGDLRWTMAVPETGRLPYDECFPALIAWRGPLHPAALLPETGIRLVELGITHPLGNALSQHLTRRLADRRIRIEQGPHKALRATFSTPHGLRILGQ